MPAAKRSPRTSSSARPRKEASPTSRAKRPAVSSSAKAKVRPKARVGRKATVRDEQGPGPFERVWAIVLRVPRGRVVTYGQISELIDRRLTPVGVGWAIRAVPEGALPWQRVVNARGGISTDPAHPGLQRAMLEAEGVRFRADGTIDLTRYGWRP